LPIPIPKSQALCGWQSGLAGLGVTAIDISNLRLALMALLPNIAGLVLCFEWRCGTRAGFNF
jgi:hypothetical protein